MRLIVDENIPSLSVDLLRRAGHDVLSIAETAPSTPDPGVMHLAVRESRILVTRDKKDFGALVYQERLPPPVAVILFRIPDTGAVAMSAFVLATIGARSDWDGTFWVVDERGIRGRPLPSQSQSG